MQNIGIFLVFFVLTKIHEIVQMNLIYHKTQRLFQMIEKYFAYKIHIPPPNTATQGIMDHRLVTNSLSFYFCDMNLYIHDYYHNSKSTLAT